MNLSDAATAVDDANLSDAVEEDADDASVCLLAINLLPADTP